MSLCTYIVQIQLLYQKLTKYKYNNFSIKLIPKYNIVVVSNIITTWLPLFDSNKKPKILPLFESNKKPKINLCSKSIKDLLP